MTVPCKLFILSDLYKTIEMISLALVKEEYVYPLLVSVCLRKKKSGMNEGYSQ